MAELSYGFNLFNDGSGNWVPVVYRNPTTFSTGQIVPPTATYVGNETQTEDAKTITGATNATPTVITSVAHGYSNGDAVYIVGVLGQTAANGIHTIAGVAADTFNLVGSVTVGAYTSGGTVQKIAKVKNAADAIMAGYQQIMNDKAAGA